MLQRGPYFAAIEVDTADSGPDRVADLQRHFQGRFVMLKFRPWLGKSGPLEHGIGISGWMTPMVLALQIPLIIHNLLNPPTPSKSYYICPAGRCGRGFSPSKQQIPFFFLSTRRMTRVQRQHRLFGERMGLIMAGREYSPKEWATMYWEERPGFRF